MAKPLSFFDWLTKQKHLRTPTGDLARAAVRDEGFPREDVTLDVVLEHMRSLPNSSGQTIAIVRFAFQAFERSQRRDPSVSTTGKIYSKP